MTGVLVQKGKTGRRRFVKREIHPDTGKVEAETGAILPQTRGHLGLPGKPEEAWKEVWGLEREHGPGNLLVWGF